jgi:hypothetical protein
MPPNPIAPQRSIMAKEITARAWSIQLPPNSTRKTRVNLATKLTKKASSKNRLCKIEPQQRNWGFLLQAERNSDVAVTALLVTHLVVDKPFW